jgi:colanic acid biosynthesis glycosyl transferase WcaI
MEYYDLEPNKVHMILNGTDIPANKKTERSIALKKLNQDQNGFYLGFLGNIWEYYDLKTILKAMELCQHEMQNLQMIMIGGGPEIDELRKKPQEMQVTTRLIFLGYVQPELLFDVMGAVDVGLMNLTINGLKDGGPVTTRFATYAAFKIPVIANSLYMENYPDELSQGLSLVPPEDPQALAEMILWLYNHPEERKQKSNFLHGFVIKNLTWDAVTKEILEIVNRDKN